MTALITSDQNPKLKHVLKIAQKASFRKKHQQFILEGKKIVTEACLNHPEKIDFLVLNETAENIKAISETKQFRTTNKLFQKVSTLKTSTGILAVMKMPNWQEQQQLQQATTIVILDQIQTPSNLGAIIRNCVAFNVDLAVLTPGTVDPYHPDSIRAMAGYHRFPIIELRPDQLNQITDAGFTTYLLDHHAKTHYQNISPLKKNAYIFGSEGRGVQTKELINTLKPTSIKINMKSTIESLNVAVTTGIILNHNHTLNQS